MKVRELKSRLARGMGDALLYLYENRGTDRFDDVIVEVCSKFTNVNFQSDGGNEAYYAQAIRTSSNQQALLERLKQKLLSSKRFDDIVRINLILYCFSEDEGTVSFCTDRYLEYFEKALLFDDGSGAVNHYGDVCRWLFERFAALSENCSKIAYRLAFSQLGGEKEFLDADDLTVLRTDDPAFWRECYQLADSEPARLLLLDRMLERTRKEYDEPVPLTRETYLNLKEIKSPYDYEAVALDVLRTVESQQRRCMDAVVSELLYHIYSHVRCANCRSLAWTLLLRLGMLSETLWNERAYDSIQQQLPPLQKPKEPVPPLLQMLFLE